MLTYLGALAGGVWGAWLAKKRGGSRFDMAQYGAGFAIFWGLVGLLLTIFLTRG